MMTKHTPGPWTLETVKTSSGICHKVGPFPWRPNKQNHACIYVDNHSHDASAPRDQELLANAHLIAAAPELLAALRKAEQFIANGVELGFIRMPDPDTPDSAHDTLPAIRAAIAKATPPQEPTPHE
jgi:hypothetical protein